ncbi:transglycosylase domain-containing protein [Mordavella massiliensis]|uniref:Penicillin-binding protein 1A n=1 Tax=Mordavella massiliensis TaxID=1871024 RepID=A0A938XB46_9CLOT|nr:PBP1A family penicillin-binding protein [Mordavella massiliensis]MBM6948256.1 PBP1A family penicillin-binding protein [Mordavella massiliensis]
MNYGKKKASKRQKQISSKAAMQGKRVSVRLLKGFILCVLAICLIGLIGGLLFAKRILDNSPEVTPDDVRPKGYTTIVYADDGATELERFVEAGSNREYKSIDQIPKDLQHAFVAIEDERFYEHNGIDPQGILRAAVQGISSGGNFSQGASTLTQQLIKNNVFPDFVNEETFYDRLERKIQEQFLALDIEKQMSKNEIMEAYLNTINLGQNTLGVQSASKRYFNKDVSELTLSECAVLAGITQNPSLYNPITNPEDNARRRTEVLDKMLDQGYINQAAYDEAIADDVYSRIQAVDGTIGEDSPYSYFIDALSEQVIDDLMSRLGYTESQAYNALYSGGLTIISTQNTTMQQICDEEMNNDANFPWLKEYGLSYALTVTRADGTIENYGSEAVEAYRESTYGIESALTFSSEDQARAMVEEWKATIAREGDTYDERITITPQPQASVTIMDQATGQIKAMVGGRGAKETSQSLNRAYRGSKRQPGSCFKIVATYAPALDTNQVTLATVFDDKPWHYSNGTEFKNVGNAYYGNVTVREAIAQSMNSVAVQTIQQIGPQLGYEYAKDNFRMSTLVEDDMYEPIALGGVNGVYNYELCAAFASIANSGTYNTPTLYTKILDHDGNVLIENPTESHQAVKDSTAALLTSAMESVVQEGSGRAAALDNMPVAGKTGTADNDKDIWFCGFTPYYTCAVWGGYDDPKSMTNIDTTFRFRIWKSIMSRIHAGLETKDFSMPASVEQKTVCTLSGQLARPGCPAVTEFFAADNSPTEACPGHGSSGGGSGSESSGGNAAADPNAGTGSAPAADPNAGGSTGGNTGGGTDPGTGGGTDPGTGGGTDPGTGGGTDPGTGGGTDPGTGGGTDPGTGGGTDPGTGGETTG